MIPCVFLPFLAENYESYLFMCKRRTHPYLFLFLIKNYQIRIGCQNFINCSRMNNSITWYPLLYITTPILSKDGDLKLDHMSHLPMVAPSIIAHTFPITPSTKWISVHSNWISLPTNWISVHFKWINVHTYWISTSPNISVSGNLAFHYTCILTLHHLCCCFDVWLSC